MHMVRRRELGECSDFGNCGKREASQTRDYCVAKDATLRRALLAQGRPSRAARPDPSPSKERLAQDDNHMRVLFEDAVVELFAFPVGCGLDEGQDDGMRFLFRGGELRLE